MVSGKVTEVLPAQQRLSGLDEVSFVRVKTDSGVLTAADLMDAQPGSRVVVCQGGPAQAVLGANCPVDAVVVCVFGAEG